ncbi:CCA tRNA nucleotidyltransferase [Oribacterium parvum]|uniref:CCA tRNA nucleotidyltransferase n=1 Tax=Oribacterium parvum TaxID=1501329 RepID=UPI0028EDF2FE|nr:CCA tRNA nucleotidyltransferase [Oribacterium parvum]
MKITMPKGAEFIIRSLENAGFEAYIVGGCVRDGILGRDPEDWDITTIAKPDEIKRIFSHTVDTGIEHGTVTVLVPPEEVERGIRSFEVTTYRIDGEYTDHRHPNAVSFTGSLEEDLARRDFTINAMAYHMERGIIDPFHGQEDLEKKIVRAVGKAKDRFAEDALRMMRGIRFSAQLDFSLDEEAYLGIESLKESLENVSKERIAVELWKLLASAHPDKVEMFFSTGLAPYITEDFPKIQESGIPKLLPFAPVEKIVRFGLFLRNVPDLARKILRDLKLDRESIEGGSHFAALFSEEEVESPYALRKRIARYGLKMVRDFYEMRLALLQQDEEELYSPLESDLLEAKRRTGEIIITKKQAESIVKERLLWITKVESEKNCVSLSELMLSGKDLISLGVSPGKRMGEILQLAFDRVLQEPKENEKEKLISYLQESGLLDS